MLGSRNRTTQLYRISAANILPASRNTPLPRCDKNVTLVSCLYTSMISRWSIANCVIVIQNVVSRESAYFIRLWWQQNKLSLTCCSNEILLITPSYWAESTLMHCSIDVQDWLKAPASWPPGSWTRLMNKLVYWRNGVYYIFEINFILFSGHCI